MQDYRKLLVWEKAHAVATMVHRLSTEIPKQENSGLIGQIRRAALSIPANIAEGSREVRRMLFGLLKRIRTVDNPPSSNPIPPPSQT
jgi:hypothetical protein